MKPGPLRDRQVAKAEAAHTAKAHKPILTQTRFSDHPSHQFRTRVQMGTGHVRSEGHLRPKPPVLFRGEPMA